MKDSLRALYERLRLEPVYVQVAAGVVIAVIVIAVLYPIVLILTFVGSFLASFVGGLLKSPEVIACCCFPVILVVLAIAALIFRFAQKRRTHTD